METNIQTNKALAGVFIFITGIILLLNQLNIILLPVLLLSWPMIIVVFGIYKLIKSKFIKAGGYIITLIGLVFIYGKIEPSFEPTQFIWPLFFISLGLALLFNSNKKNVKWKMKCEKHYYNHTQTQS